MVKHWLSGAVAGSLHAISGPDHLAALIPLCIGKGYLAFQEGLIWGLGHGLGCSILGSIGVVFKQMIDIEIFSEYMEFAVGLTLMLIGVIGIRRAMKWNEKQHTFNGDALKLHHQKKNVNNEVSNCKKLIKDNENNNHLLLNMNISPMQQKSDKKENIHLSSFSTLLKYCSYYPNICYRKLLKIQRHFFHCIEYSPLLTILLTGIFHGLSGTGHILGVIPALTYNDVSTGMKYLFAFCVGTAIAMSLFTMFVGLIGVMIVNSVSNGKTVDEGMKHSQSMNLPAKLSFGAGIFSLIVGIFWIVQPLIERY